MGWIAVTTFVCHVPWNGMGGFCFDLWLDDLHVWGDKVPTLLALPTDGRTLRGLAMEDVAYD
jgi:hypothetical protein